MAQPTVYLPTTNTATFLKDDMPDDSTPNQLTTIDPEQSITADYNENSSILQESITNDSPQPLSQEDTKTSQTDETVYIDAQSLDQCRLYDCVQSQEKI